MKVKLPNSYRDKGDSVSFSLVGKDGKKHDHLRAACYYRVVYPHRPGAWQITCFPYQGKNSAPPLMFQRFFRKLIGAPQASMTPSRREKRLSPSISSGLTTLRCPMPPQLAQAP